MRHAPSLESNQGPASHALTMSGKRACRMPTWAMMLNARDSASGPSERASAHT